MERAQERGARDGFRQEIGKHVGACGVDKVNLRVLDHLANKVELDFDVLQTPGVGVGLGVCYRNTNLIVFVDGGGRDVARDANLEAKLPEPQEFSRVIHSGSVFRFTQRQGYRRLFLGVPANNV